MAKTGAGKDAAATETVAAADKKAKAAAGKKVLAEAVEQALETQVREKTVAAPVKVAAKKMAAKAVIKDTGKAMSKGASKDAGKGAAGKQAPEAEPEAKPRKPKLVRDSFTMPEEEYAVLTDLKKACTKAGIEVKKSELLRVGVALLKRHDIDGIREVLAGLPALKAGRPKKGKQDGK